MFHEDSTEAIHWASYHAQKQRSRCTTTVVNGVLPIFDAKSTDPSLVKHVIDRTSEIVQDLNRGHVLFITADQPIYAFCKRLQWYNPSTYGLKKVFLYLEVCMEFVLGDYFNGSGVTDILRSAKVSSTTDASFLSGGNIMKTCLNYQVLAVVLYQQLQVAYRASDADEQFDTRTNKKCQDSCNFKYWHMGLELILKYLMFVRAFRESDFNLYKRSLCSWLSWFWVQSPKLSTVCYNTFY